MRCDSVKSLDIIEEIVYNTIVGRSRPKCVASGNATDK
jgi:hypothetical protein